MALKKIDDPIAAIATTEIPFGTLKWFASAYGDPEVPYSFMTIFGDNEPTKQKRPMEIALAALERAEIGTKMIRQDIASRAIAPACIRSFFRSLAWSDEFSKLIVGLGFSKFLRSVAIHIVGSFIEEQSPAFKRIDRAIYTEITSPILNAALETKPTSGAEAAIPDHLWAMLSKRDHDGYVALLSKAYKLGEEMAELFLQKAGLHGDELMAASTLNKAMDFVYTEWNGRAFNLMQAMLTQGALINAIEESLSLLHERTRYRRKTETQPRLTIVREVNGSDIALTGTFRDKSDHNTIRTRVVGAYKFMAYEATQTEVQAIATNSDINELLFDLTLPRHEEPVETEVDLSQAYTRVTNNNKASYWYADHVKRLLAADAFAHSGELLGFALELPRGCEKEIFSINPITKVVSSTPGELITMIQNRDLFTAAEMTLFGLKYMLEGVGAMDYARWFATQTFASVLPKDTETGKVDVVASDANYAPSKTTDMLTLVKESQVLIDRTLIGRIAEQGLNNKSLISDQSITIIGVDLLKYYWKIAKLLGFDTIKNNFRAIDGNTFTLKSIADLEGQELILSWTTPQASVVRLRPLGLANDRKAISACITLESFINKIGNDKVVKAFMQALSLYLVYDTTSVNVEDIPTLWNSFLS